MCDVLCILGFVISAVSIQLGFEPPKSLAWLETIFVFIWILLGGLVGLLLGLLVQESVGQSEH